MIDAKKLGPDGCKYLGTPYSKMDCQAFWERVLKDCGLNMDLGGSNSWYRYMMQHGWVGTPEECTKTFGGVPIGATLFIHEAVSESTPAQFRDDGIGDITHMGIYTGMTGKEMAQIAIEDGVKHADKYNYGDGALHSSSSRDGVCTSKFAGKTIPNGGWNRVGLLLEKIVYDGTTPPEPPPDPHPEPDKAIVVAESGSTVKMRARPTQKCKLYWDVPIGAEVQVDEWNAETDSEGQVWAEISWDGKNGYMIQSYLRDEDVPQPAPPGTTWIVTIPGLSLEQAKALVRSYPGATMEEGFG